MRISDFEKRPFWIFFAWSPWKSVTNYVVEWMGLALDGTSFWCFPWFPANPLLCVIYRYTVRAVYQPENNPMYQIWIPSQIKVSKVLLSLYMMWFSAQLLYKRIHSFIPPKSTCQAIRKGICSFFLPFFSYWFQLPRDYFFCITRSSKLNQFPVIS